MTDFQVHGPFEVPVHHGAAGRIVRAAEGTEFFGSHPALAPRRGCYVFGIRAGGGITPVYVGKTHGSFAEECFTPHKLGKYNEGLVEYARGTPVLFLLTPPERRGPPNQGHINELEAFLIQTGVAANEDLLNVQGTGGADWTITGVLRAGQGRPSDSASLFKTMMRF